MMDLEISNDPLQEPYSADELKHLSDKETSNHGAKYVKVEKDDSVAAVELNDLENGNPTDGDEDINEQDENVERHPLQGICTPIDKVLTIIEESCKLVYRGNKSLVKMIIVGVLASLYITYVGVACARNFNKAVDLFAISIFALFCVAYWIVKKFFGKWINTMIFKPIVEFIRGRKLFFKWAGIIIIIIPLILWIAIDTVKDVKRLVSFAGLATYILIGYIFSKHRSRVEWRPVIWGFGLQFVFGILILRTTPGRVFFKWLGDRVLLFLTFADEGSKFVFGKDKYKDHFFAFKVLPVVVFFSAFVYMLYYFGIMQVIIKKIAWLMQVTMGTSAAESLNAAGNIFIGMSEAPLLIRPFLPNLTMSEIHAVMTGGFATIAGSVLGAFILYGVSASHLLAASVMSAPAALAISKLMYPETEEAKTKRVEDIEIPRGEEKNFIEALAAGASMSVLLVANIAVMLIAFIAVLAFVDGVLCWGGNLVGVCITFKLICSYVLMPFAYVMGVSWDDCFIVAELLGIKTFLNEFVAYEEMNKLIKNRRQQLPGSKLSLRSEVIATYALCGFANIGSIGIQIGCLSALAPKRRSDLVNVAVRAMIAGTIACFMTACIAGILYQEGFDDSKIPLATRNTTVLISTVKTVLTTTATP